MRRRRHRAASALLTAESFIADRANEVRVNRGQTTFVQALG